jgi:uracil-DNA glycosylase family 4
VTPDAAGSWDELAARVRMCTACPELTVTRTQVVPGVAPPGVEVLIVGEAPGAREDEAGVPFVGRAGQLLDSLLEEVGLPRDRVAVTNVLKCRPPSNRKPRRLEVERCRPWLRAQIAVLDPVLILALGGTAAEWFAGASARVAMLRAQRLDYEGRALIVSYHPSAAIRFGPRGMPLAALREDLARAAELLESLRRGTR